MRREDREVTNFAEIKRIIEDTKILHLGLFDEEYPYIVPLHYGYEFVEDKLVFYMHSAKEGHKLDLINSNSSACVEIENDIELILGGDIPCKYGSRFSSVIARGTVEILSEDNSKIHALKTIMKHQTGRNFEIDEKMANIVEVLQFTANSYTAKANVMPK